jgi:hypothetical protein
LHHLFLLIFFIAFPFAFSIWLCDLKYSIKQRFKCDRQRLNKVWALKSTEKDHNVHPAIYYQLPQLFKTTQVPFNIIAIFQKHKLNWICLLYGFYLVLKLICSIPVRVYFLIFDWEQLLCDTNSLLLGILLILIFYYFLFSLYE